MKQKEEKKDGDKMRKNMQNESKSWKGYECELLYEV